MTEYNSLRVPLALGLLSLALCAAASANAQVRFPEDKGWTSAPSKAERGLCFALSKQLSALPANTSRNAWPDLARAPGYSLPAWRKVPLKGHEDLVVTAFARKRVPAESSMPSAADRTAARSLYAQMAAKGEITLSQATIGQGPRLTKLYRIDFPGQSLGTLKSARAATKGAQRSSIIVIEKTWQDPKLADWPVQPNLWSSAGIIWRGSEFWMLEPRTLSVRKLVINPQITLVGNAPTCSLREY